MDPNYIILAFAMTCAIAAAAIKWKGQTGWFWFYGLAVFILLFVRIVP